MSKFLRFKSLTLEMAQDVAAKAVQTAKDNQFKPIGVVVLDSAGKTIVQLCMHHCPSGFLPIAEAKANTCIKVGVSSRAYGKKYLSKDGTPDVFVRLTNQMMILDGNVACFQGGILIRDKHDKSVLGAVGVSGAAGDEDEYCALMCAQRSMVADDVVTEPAQHACQTCKL